MILAAYVHTPYGPFMMKPHNVGWPCCGIIVRMRTLPNVFTLHSERRVSVLR